MFETYKKQLQTATKRIQKANKPKQIATLQDIRKEIIEAINQLSRSLHNQYRAVSETDPKAKQAEQDRIFALYKALRDRALVALATLQQHSLQLSKQTTDEQDKADLELLATPFQLPGLGASVDESAAPLIDLFDDLEPEDSDTELVIANESDNTMAFDLKAAATIVPYFEGEADELDKFLAGVRLLTRLMPDAEAELLLEFVKSRLNKKARDVAGSATTIESMIEKLQQSCTSTTNSETEEARLAAMKQKGKDATTFATEIQTLTDGLSNMYIKEGVPPSMAQRLANKAGVHALVNGIRNPQIKILLLSGRYETVADATTKLLVEEQSAPEVAKVFQQATSNRPPRGQGRGRYRSNNYRGRGQSSNSSNYSRNNDGRRNENHRRNDNNTNRGRNDRNDRTNRNERNIRTAATDDFLDDRSNREAQRQ